MMTKGDRIVRLKVNVSQSIRFYVGISSIASLQEFKKTISNILKRNYNQIIENFKIKSEDGYEILEYFTIGDILSDNQVVCVDAFAFSATNHFLEEIQQNVENFSTEKKKHDKDRSHHSEVNSHSNEDIEAYFDKKKSYLKEKDENMKQLELSLKSKFKNKDNDLRTGNNEARIILPKEKIGFPQESMHDIKYNSTVMNEPLNNQTLSIQKDSSLESNAYKNDNFHRKNEVNVSTSSNLKPIFENNFKGFAVKKDDLDSKEQRAISTLNFKPLKRKKHTEDSFEPI